MFKIVKNNDLCGYFIRKENRSVAPKELLGLYTSKLKAQRAIDAYMVKYEKEMAKLEEENKKLKAEVEEKKEEEKKAPAKKRTASKKK